MSKIPPLHIGLRAGAPPVTGLPQQSQLRSGDVHRALRWRRDSIKGCHQHSRIDLLLLTQDEELRDVFEAASQSTHSLDELQPAHLMGRKPMEV